MPKFNVEMNIDKNTFNELISLTNSNLDDDLTGKINNLIETDFIPVFKKEINHILERAISLVFEKDSPLIDEYNSDELIEYVESIIDSTDIVYSIEKLIEEEDIEGEIDIKSNNKFKTL